MNYDKPQYISMFALLTLLTRSAIPLLQGRFRIWKRRSLGGCWAVQDQVLASVDKMAKLRVAFMPKTSWSIQVIHSLCTVEAVTDRQTDIEP